jgi:hypothetical protein
VRRPRLFDRLRMRAMAGSADIFIQSSSKDEDVAAAAA